MQCQSCKAKWDLDSSTNKVKLNACPFCGASLEPEEKPDLKSIGGILRFIVLNYGESIYENQNANRFKALLADLAVSFPKERDWIRIAIDKQIPSRLLKKNKSDDDEKSNEIKESCFILADMGLQETIAQKTLALLSYGLGWTSITFPAQIQTENSNTSKASITKKIRTKHVRSTVPSKASTASSKTSNMQKSPKMKFPLLKMNKVATFVTLCLVLVVVTISIFVTNIIKQNSIETIFVYVEGDTFRMGSNDYDEKPVHYVDIASFYMCDHEVTQKEFREVMGTNPSRFSGDNRPVENVNWYDAVEYCNALSQKEGLTPCYIIDKSSRRQDNISTTDPLKWIVTCNFNADGYRLPTEAEWEYAARGGRKRNAYTYSGSNIVSKVAWCDENSGYTTHDVKTKLSNELGLYDMSGNVCEWCWDWYGSYSSLSQTNPVGVSSGSYRVLRGGSWYSSAYYSSVCYRNYYYPNYRYGYLGFRVVRSSSK